MIDDLMKTKVKDALDEFCILYSPECEYRKKESVNKW